MYFNNFSDLIAMDGHGFYVWFAYAFAFAVLIYNLIVPALSYRRIMQKLRRQKKIEQQRRVNRCYILPSARLSSQETEKERVGP
ncbi:MAG: heme exporter protein CcmD [Endozoicomonas sp. (ex Botrylloides leachii)]|nr:heme exporter protein CcmD [Endozoicomonas sp. (ex Botrylloides leachii)]